MIYTLKNTRITIPLKAIFVISILCLVAQSSIFGQNQRRNLFSATRSNPDLLPESEFIYLAPRDGVNTPSTQTPPPYSNPGPSTNLTNTAPIRATESDKTQTTISPPFVDQTPPSQSATLAPFQSIDKILPTPDLTPPTQSATLTPFQTVTSIPTPAENDPPYQGIDIRPTEGANTYPAQNPASTPEYNIARNQMPPSSEIDPMSPDSLLQTIPATSPNPFPSSPAPPQGAITRAPGKNIAPSGNVTIPPSSLGSNEEAQPPLRFTLAPEVDTNNTTNPSIETRTAKPAPQESNIRLITNLQNQQYVQLAAYSEKFQAERAITSLINTNFPVSSDLIQIYQKNHSNTNYYKVLIGPFTTSEIGVQLYHIRKQGHKDAFIVR